jgi:hypothetical protein
MEPGPGRNVEDPLGAALLEQFDEEIAFALVARVPIDQFVPLVDETLDVFLLVMVGIADLQRILAVVLFGGIWKCA